LLDERERLATAVGQWFPARSGELVQVVNRFVEFAVDPVVDLSAALVKLDQVEDQGVVFGGDRWARRGSRRDDPGF
jgi:hypothetical protein